MENHWGEYKFINHCRAIIFDTRSSLGTKRRKKSREHGIDFTRATLDRDSPANDDSSATSASPKAGKNISLLPNDHYRIGGEIVIISIIAIINSRGSIHRVMSSEPSLFSRHVFLTRDRGAGGGGRGRKGERSEKSDNGRYQKRSDEITHGIGSRPGVSVMARVNHARARESTFVNAHVRAAPRPLGWREGATVTHYRSSFEQSRRSRRYFRCASLGRPPTGA